VRTCQGSREPRGLVEIVAVQQDYLEVGLAVPA